MVNPWDAGMGPREVGGGGGYGAHASAFGAAGMGMGSSGGGGSGGGTSHLLGSLNQLSQMGNDKSKLALNILSAVLQSVSYFIYFLVPLMFFSSHHHLYQELHHVLLQQDLFVMCRI